MSEQLPSECIMIRRVIQVAGFVISQSKTLNTQKNRPERIAEPEVHRPCQRLFHRRGRRNVALCGRPRHASRPSCECPGHLVRCRCPRFDRSRGRRNSTTSKQQTCRINHIHFTRNESRQSLAVASA